MTSFQTVQKQFTHAIRNPEQAKPKSEDEARRLAVYQSLFFNNITNFLESGFPVIFDILTEEQGIELTRHFFAEHHCRSPYFAQISKEFVEYLSSAPDCLSAFPDWLPELAHYEWMELDVSIRKTSAPVSFWKDESFPNRLRVSPLASLVSYAYPVHLLGPDFTAPEMSDNRHYYVIYRNHDDGVDFMVLNPLTAMLINMIEQSDEAMSVEAVVTSLCKQVPALPPQQIETGAQQTLSEMLKRGIVIAGD